VNPRELSTIRSLLRLFTHINIHPAYFLVPVLLSVSAAACEGIGMGLLIPLLQGFLTRDFSFLTQTPILSTVVGWLPAAVRSSDRLLFAFLLSVFVTAVILKNVLKYFSAVSLSYLSARALHHLRKVLFGRYLSFGKLYFDRTAVGHHAAVLSEFAPSSLTPLVRVNTDIHAFFSLVAYLIIMFAISWKLTLVAVPLFAVLHLSVRAIIEKIYTYSRSMSERYQALGKKVVETLSLIPLVKSSNTESQELQQYTSISDEQAMLDYRISVLRNLIVPLQELIALVAILLLFSGMLYLLVREGTAAAPSFMVYFYLVFNSANKFGTLTALRSHLAAAAGPLAAIGRIFDDADKEYVPDGTRTFDGLEREIEFRDLSFSYGSREILSRVSFTVEKGSMTAIAGPTGAGKTTLISLLLRYYDCPPGTIFFDGTDIREFRTATLRQRMGLVSQDTLLLHDTLRANILYGLEEADEERLQDVLRQARLADFVAELPSGLETLIGDRGVKLSGGEKQRVSIARALLKDADILILDEATSSLDSRTEKLIQEAMNEAMRGRTAIVIAHRLSTIQHADKIVVIDQGQSVEQGTLEELLERHGLFSTLWEEQKFV
jgi:subfamily B ATP-binding cassette protein MsbA